MARIKPLKLRMYEGVCRMNQNFEVLLENLRQLQELQVFPQRFLRACEGRAEQLRAEANRELTQVLHLCEAADSDHFSRKLVALERRVERARRRFGRVDAARPRRKQRRTG